MGVACGTTECMREEVEITYKYVTTCADVVTPRSGKISFTLPKGRRSRQDVSSALTQEWLKAGWDVEEINLVWQETYCKETLSSDAPNAVKALGIERIVLSPSDPDRSGSIQRLMACDPVQKNSTTLKQNFLLACRKGLNSPTSCTISLEYIKP